MKKTLILLNLRFANFYSKHLLQYVKNLEEIRIIAVVDHQFENKIPDYIANYLDEIITLNSNPKLGFLGEFIYDDLKLIVQKELAISDEIRIICSDEFNLLNAGKLRAEFNLKGHTEKELLPFRDKMLMKKIISDHGIRVPKNKMLEKSDRFEALKTNIGLPFIIKPVDSCGSHGVRCIQTQADFDQFRDEIEIVDNDFQVEEFIQGKLYHVDSWIKDNDLHFICANEYTYPNYEYTKGKPLGSIPLNPDQELSFRLVDFAKNCLQALKANNIINHMELFINQHNEIIFLEVSGRPPGGFINLTHQINFGINLMNEDFIMQADVPIFLEQSKPTVHAFFMMFPLIPGKISKLNPPNTHCEYDITWHVQIGDEIHERDCGNIVGKAAHAIFYHPNKQVLLKDFASIKHHQAIEV